MLQVALKSLLDRKLRLLLSTSAIVLGVGFVAGSLVFTDMLSSGFDQDLRAAPPATSSSATVNGVGRVRDPPTNKTVPASLVDELSAHPGRGPGRRQRERCQRASS